jgi:hypothetical protein
MQSQLLPHLDPVHLYLKVRLSARFSQLIDIYNTRAEPATMAPNMAATPTKTPLEMVETDPADRELVAAAALEEAAEVWAAELAAAETPVADSGGQHECKAKYVGGVKALLSITVIG